MTSTLFTVTQFHLEKYQRKSTPAFRCGIVCVVKKHTRQDDTMSPWKKDLLHSRNARALMQECKQSSSKSLKLP